MGVVLYNLFIVIPSYSDWGRLSPKRRILWNNYLGLFVMFINLKDMSLLAGNTSKERGGRWEQFCIIYLSRYLVLLPAGSFAQAIC